MAAIVVVGSGINGLVAAADLSSRGHSVTVLERGPTPGGAVRTEELTLPGFRHDVAAMNLSMFAGSAFMKAHGATLHRHGLEFVAVDRPFASSFADGWFGVSTNVDETLASIRQDTDRAAWRALMADFPDRAALVGGLLGSPMTVRGLGAIGWKSLRSRKAGGTLDLIRFLLSSPRTWLEETFADAHLRTALGTWGMHLDFAPDIAGGAIFPYLEAMAGQAFGMVIGRGGADTVTRALVAMITAQGGSVRCNAEVEEILVRGGTATGVRLASGEVVEAATVLANLAPRGLMRLLPRASGDARFDRGMAAFRHAPGTMMIHLALSDLPPWRQEALRRFAYVHIAPSLDAIAAMYAQATSGILPVEPALVVGQPTIFDPSRAPEGRHTLWVQVRALPAEIRGDAGGTLSGPWESVKEAYADRMIALIEAQAPGFRDTILARTVVSPLDLEAGNPNLVGGDQLCGSHHLTQNFLFRPLRGHADGSTPVKGLHLIGAAVWPGAGTGAGSGFMVARGIR